jgi:DNA-binding MarR family transcriptional regulator
MNSDTDKTLYDIFTLHYIINKVFFKNFEYQYPLEDLNFTHVRTMITLTFEQPCAMSTVSEKMGLEKGSFSPVAHHLIKQGYVIKSQDTADKRVYYLELTQKGKDFAEKVMADHLLYIEGEIEKFPKLEKDIYLNAIKLIISMTEKLS